MRRGLALAVIALAAAGCGGSHRAAAPVVQGRAWRAVIDDWLAHGRVAQPHSCGALVVALSHVRLVPSMSATAAIDRAAGSACTHHPRLDAIAVGMTNNEVAQIAGMPRTPGANCWLYPVTLQHTGRRVCFTNGRATIVQISVHG